MRLIMDFCHLNIKKDVVVVDTTFQEKVTFLTGEESLAIMMKYSFRYNAKK